MGFKTTTVQLTVKTKIGEDEFGADVYEETEVDVDGVLIGNPSTDDITSTLELYGKRVEYVLGIPKGDTHNWYDTTVSFWGMKFRTIGYPMKGEPENIPLRWGQNIKVEAYG